MAEEPLGPESRALEQGVGPFISVMLVQCQRCFEWVYPGFRMVLDDPTFPSWGRTLPLIRHFQCPVPYEDDQGRQIEPDAVVEEGDDAA